MSEDDLTVDDILGDINDNEAEIESLKDTIEDLQSEIPDDDDIPDLPDVPTEEEIDAHVRGTLEHLVTEDCEGEWCNDVREQLGLDVDAEQGPDHDHDDDGDDDPEEPEEPDADDGGDDSDDGDDDDDGPITNAFGEPV